MRLPPDTVIHEFDHATASDDQVGALVDLQRAWRSERSPGDPQRPRQRWIDRYRAGNVHGSISGAALASADHDPAGFASWEISVIDNPQSTFLQVFVRPEMRRRGIGSALALRALQAAAHAGATDAGFCLAEHLEVGRSLIETIEQEWAISPAFLERAARLAVRDLDADGIQADLIARRARVPDAYRLEFFEMDAVPPPETGFDLADYASMVQRIWNLMPLEDLKLQEEVFTPESFARLVDLQRAQGRIIWNYVAVDRETGACVGVTNISFDPEDPRMISQWDTGVLAEHQGNGLGKLLKLEMLSRVLEQLPEALYIDTENAASNDAMIAINNALGFREHIREKCYQVAVDALRNRLAGTEAGT